MEVYKIIEPTVFKVPVIISSPHSGTAIPDDIRSQFRPEMIAAQDDADWFIDKLYDFAPQLGITMICANLSRWVIDLNRDPQSKPLYNDGRVITGLVPTTNFNGAPLYIDKEPDAAEIQNRIDNYYTPYHEKLRELLAEAKTVFGKSLLFDTHSIRRLVPGIQEKPFPDLILGDNDETSASKKIIAKVYEALQKDKYEVSHNHPFKGGQITRSFGNPENSIHALQLEMAKVNYLDDSETKYDEEKANRMRTLLQNMFVELINELG